MRFRLPSGLPLALVAALAACDPVSGLSNLVSAGNAPNRAAVEVAVKSDFPALIDEIGAGGGPLLARAYDAARVPETDRPARTLALNGNLGLYASSPDALVAALVAAGRP